MLAAVISNLRRQPPFSVHQYPGSLVNHPTNALILSIESRMGIYSPLESSRVNTYHVIIRDEYLLSGITHRLQNFRKTQESSLHLDPRQPSITRGAHHKIFSRLRLTFSFDRSEDTKILV
jgi:hypothetical protein